MATVVPERVVERILARIERQPDGCWIWPGAKYQSGYGHIAWQSSNVQTHTSTHRALYIALVGPVGEGLDLDHLCRVRACCNPAHLEPVTRQTNLLRGDTAPARRAAQTHCKRAHEFTADNTRIDSKGRRICKECARERNRAVDPAVRSIYNRRARLKARSKPV